MKEPHVYLYTIRDKVANEAGDIFSARNDGVACRSFNKLLSENTYAKKTDYQLLKLGSYNYEAVTILIYDEVEDITPSELIQRSEFPELLKEGV